MKLLILSGSHPRHYFITSKILPIFSKIKIICMQREELTPKFESLNDNLDKLVKHHFDKRNLKEEAVFGKLSYLDTEALDVQTISPASLNSNFVKDEIKSFNADIGVVCGTYILDSEFLGILPKTSINIHLGLSPWYRGSATLFWPNYFLEPWKTGITFHFLNKYADSGDIIHQCKGNLEEWMGVHDAAISNIIKASEDLSDLVKFYKKNLFLNSKPQQFVGRSFLTKDFNPYHLKLIYELFDDKVIKYLMDRFKFPEVKLVQPNI